jgi:hypothetical protein
MCAPSLFSQYLVRYDAIRDMELNYACGTGKSAVLKNIYEWMINASADHLKRNADVLAHLIMKLGDDGSPTLSVPPSPRPWGR